MGNSIISEPQVNINIISAQQFIGNTDQKVLFVGQMTSAGTATPNTLITNIDNSGEESTLFGARSMLAQMIRAAKKINKVTQFDVLPISDNASGVAATGSIAVSGTATAAGTIEVMVGSAINNTYSIAVNSGDTAATIASNIQTAISNDANVPVTATVATSTVTLTCAHKGIWGNKIGLQIIGSVAGVTFTLTGFASGATDPVLTTVFSPIGDERYQTVIWPNNYTKSTVVSFLDGRFNSSNAILDGVAFCSNTDTEANLKTLLAGLNSKSLVVNCNTLVNDTYYKGSALFELDDVIAAELGAIYALRLTDGADISRYVISTYGARDTFGGTALASMPLFNTPFYNLPLIPTGRGFAATDIADLNSANGSVIGNNVANNTVIAGAIYTTYKTDSAGNPDSSYEFLEYVSTITNAREFFFNNLKARFAQSRLTQGDVVPGRSMANQQIIESYLDSLYLILAGEDYVLVQGGATAFNYFKQNRVVSLDLISGTVTVTMVVPIIVQLRTFNVTMQLSFNIKATN